MDSNILTVEQVAAELDLHPKTVRRFIQEGKLKAGKIGKQWRITREDLQELMNTGKPIKPETETNEENIMEIPINQSDNSVKLKVQVSTVVDVYVADTDEAVRITNTLFAVMNCKDPSYGGSRCDHVFFKNELKARYILWGSPKFISNILECLTAIVEKRDK